MNIFIWLLFGLIAGMVAHLLDSRPARGGITAAIAFGMLGAFIGGLAANYLFGVQLMRFDLVSLLIAVFGSLTILLVHRTVFTNPDNRF